MQVVIGGVAEPNAKAVEDPRSCYVLHSDDLMQVGCEGDTGLQPRQDVFRLVPFLEVGYLS